MASINWDEAELWIEDWQHFVFKHFGVISPTVPLYVDSLFAEHGERSQRGEKNVNARLTIEDVKTIRELAETISSSELANEFGVSPTHINRVVTFKRWVDEEKP